MTGSAKFINLSTQDIQYNEQGSYQLKDKDQSYYQKRIFSLTAETLLILKSDKTPLHAFKLSDTTQFPFKMCHTHFCSHDSYSLEMIFHTSTRFSTHYQVEGPSKDYTIHTDFKREEKNGQ